MRVSAVVDSLIKTKLHSKLMKSHFVILILPHPTDDHLTATDIGSNLTRGREQTEILLCIPKESEATRTISAKKIENKDFQITRTARQLNCCLLCCSMCSHVADIFSNSSDFTTLILFHALVGLSLDG